MDCTCRAYGCTLAAEAAFVVVDVSHIVFHRDGFERTFLDALAATYAGIDTSLAGYCALVFVHTADEKASPPRGRLFAIHPFFGVFMIMVFGSRFFIELLKNNQEAFEDSMVLNMGQLLSIPFVVAGCWFVWQALTRRQDAHGEEVVAGARQVAYTPKAYALFPIGERCLANHAKSGEEKAEQIIQNILHSRRFGTVR